MPASKKTYVAIAAAVKKLLSESPNRSYRVGVSDSMKRLADVLKADNPQFRYDTFFEACGLDTWGDVITKNDMTRETVKHRR